MDETTAERLQRLEATVAHLEHLYDQLNTVVVEQGKQLAWLQAQQQHVSRTVETMELERIQSNNAKPPHYQ